jgi:hypothetical protein
MKKTAGSSILVVVMLLAVAVIAEGQQPKKVTRIGYLSGADRASESTRSEAIRLAAMWMSSTLHTRPLFSFFLHDFSTSRPKRDLLLFVARPPPSHLLEMRPSLGHKAPGSLSLASNRQELLSPGSASRRVVPWGDVSSWVKGAE